MSFYGFGTPLAQFPPNYPQFSGNFYPHHFNASFNQFPQNTPFTNSWLQNGFANLSTGQSHLLGQIPSSQKSPNLNVDCTPEDEEDEALKKQQQSPKLSETKAVSHRPRGASPRDSNSPSLLNLDSFTAREDSNILLSNQPSNFAEQPTGFLQASSAQKLPFPKTEKQFLDLDFCENSPSSLQSQNHAVGLSFSETQMGKVGNEQQDFTKAALVASSSPSLQKLPTREVATQNLQQRLDDIVGIVSNRILNSSITPLHVEVSKLAQGKEEILLQQEARLLFTAAEMLKKNFAILSDQSVVFSPVHSSFQQQSADLIKQLQLRVEQTEREAAELRNRFDSLQPPVLPPLSSFSLQSPKSALSTDRSPSNGVPAIDPSFRHQEQAKQQQRQALLDEWRVEELIQHHTTQLRDLRLHKRRTHLERTASPSLTPRGTSIDNMSGTTATKSTQSQLSNGNHRTFVIKRGDSMTSASGNSRSSSPSISVGSSKSSLHSSSVCSSSLRVAAGSSAKQQHATSKISSVAPPSSVNSSQKSKLPSNEISATRKLVASAAGHVASVPTSRTGLSPARRTSSPMRTSSPAKTANQQTPVETLQRKPAVPRFSSGMRQSSSSAAIITPHRTNSVDSSNRAQRRTSVEQKSRISTSNGIAVRMAPVSIFKSSMVQHQQPCQEVQFSSSSAAFSSSSSSSSSTSEFLTTEKEPVEAETGEEYDDVQPSADMGKNQINAVLTQGRISPESSISFL